MSSFAKDVSRNMRNDERVLMDITSASAAASASASASARTCGVEGIEREQATKESRDIGNGNMARSSSTECDETAVSGDVVEEGENENPLLMSDISRMMETMHSKNLMLKKLVRMQQNRLELFKTENEELRRDGKRKDARLRNADVTIEYLQVEVEQQRMMIQKKNANKVRIEEDTHLGANNKNKNSGCNATTKTNSMAKASVSSKHKRCVHVPLKTTLERLVRRIKGMKGSTKGITVCICTLGSAILLRSVLNTMNKNSDYSKS